MIAKSRPDWPNPKGLVLESGGIGFVPAGFTIQSKLNFLAGSAPQHLGDLFNLFLRR